jgi:FtsP/CotA-like multicopper oxidase with cupredoxin domain
VSIHPQLQKQVNFWGANLGGADLRVDPPMTPLPTLVSRYQAGANTAILVRRYNDLPQGVPSGGYGRNQISIHLHNFHTVPDSDGGPCDPRLGADADDPLRQGRFFFPDQYYDDYYNMKRAGFTRAATPDGDVRESLGTLWYHDHREAHTRENVFKGLAGIHIIFNEHDCGDETRGLRLPGWPHWDLPLVLKDVRIDPATQQGAFDLFDTDGYLGDRYLVNGRIQPYQAVARRRYRYRVLNGSLARYYQLYLTNPDRPEQSIAFWLIANDGNLLPRPVNVNSVRLSNGERADLVIDFARISAADGPAPGTRHQAPGTRHQAPGTRHQAPGTRHQSTVAREPPVVDQRPRAGQRVAAARTQRQRAGRVPHRSARAGRQLRPDHRRRFRPAHPAGAGHPRPDADRPARPAATLLHRAGARSPGRHPADVHLMQQRLPTSYAQSAGCA